MLLRLRHIDNLAASPTLILIVNFFKSQTKTLLICSYLLLWIRLQKATIEEFETDAVKDNKQE